jgi:hypothetical protein
VFLLERDNVDHAEPLAGVEVNVQPAAFTLLSALYGE